MSYFFSDGIKNISHLINQKKELTSQADDELMLLKVKEVINKDILDAYKRNSLAYDEPFNRFIKDTKKYSPSAVLNQLDQLHAKSSGLSQQAGLIVMDDKHRISSIARSAYSGELDLGKTPLPHGYLEEIRGALAQVPDDYMDLILGDFTFESAYSFFVSSRGGLEHLLRNAYYDSYQDFEAFSAAEDLRGLLSSNGFCREKRHASPQFVLKELQDIIQDNMGNKTREIKDTLVGHLSSHSPIFNDFFEDIKTYESWITGSNMKIATYEQDRSTKTSLQKNYTSYIERAMEIHDESILNIREMNILENDKRFTALDAKAQLIYQEAEKRVLRKYLYTRKKALENSSVLPEDFSSTLDNLDTLVTLRQGIKDFVCSLNAMSSEVGEEKYLFLLKSKEQEYLDFIDYVLSSELANSSQFTFYNALSVQDVTEAVIGFKRNSQRASKREEKKAEKQRDVLSEQKKEGQRAFFDFLAEMDV